MTCRVVTTVLAQNPAHAFSVVCGRLANSPLVRVDTGPLTREVRNLA